MNATKSIANSVKTLCTLAAALAWVGQAQAGIPIQHWTQPSGAAIYLVESPAVPMVDVRIEFDAGGRRDPPEQAGLASMSAGMMGKGVRATATEPALDENALSEAWADLGASFSGGDGVDRVSFSLRSLTYPDLLARAAALASRQLGEPAWPEAVWTREREQQMAALREANTQPGTIAARAFKQAVFGSHPYGHDVNEATLKRISVADMQAWHARYLRACRAKVSIVGAVTRAQADALAAQMLSRLPGAGSCERLPPVAEVKPLSEAVQRNIPFDAAQAHVLIGQPGFKRDDPDYFALVVGNYILGGGGFVSRLTEEVRERRGLSYSVYSYFNPGLHAGAFTVGLQTRPDQAAQAVQVAREVLRRFVDQGPTAAELKAAKDNLIGGFALRIDNNRKLLDNVSNIAAHELPLDYLDTWGQQVARITLADIRAAFARKLHPERMVTVVVGGGDGR